MPIPPRPRHPGARARVTTARLEAMADDVLLAPVAAARNRIQNPRELSERVAFGKALWRELVIGFAAQLGEVRLGFTQLAALYALADGGTTTIADLSDTLNRSPSATSRLVDGLERRRLLERRAESEDRRMRSVWLTGRGRALLAVIDRSRADQFLAVVRPLPATERAIVAMGVAALATRAVSRRGRLIKQRPE
jgi:DNA-binding MarR family transcriptional regulator